MHKLIWSRTTWSGHIVWCDKQRPMFSYLCKALHGNALQNLEYRSCAACKDEENRNVGRLGCVVKQRTPMRLTLLLFILVGTWPSAEFLPVSKNFPNKTLKILVCFRPFKLLTSRHCSCTTNRSSRSLLHSRSNRRWHKTLTDRLPQYVQWSHNNRLSLRCPPDQLANESRFGPSFRHTMSCKRVALSRTLYLTSSFTEISSFRSWHSSCSFILLLTFPFQEEKCNFCSQRNLPYPSVRTLKS